MDDICAFSMKVKRCVIFSFLTRLSNDA